MRTNGIIEKLSMPETAENRDLGSRRRSLARLGVSGVQLHFFLNNRIFRTLTKAELQGRLLRSDPHDLEVGSTNPHG